MNSLDDLEVGDVIERNGKFRVVRKVARYRTRGGKGTLKIAIYLTIRHCSWTRACYTLYTTDELRRLGYRRAPMRVKLNSDLDQEIAGDFNYPETKRRLNCKAVKGVL